MPACLPSTPHPFRSLSQLLPPLAGRSEEVLRLGLGVLLEMMVRRMEAAGGSAGPSGAAAAAAAEDSKEAAAGAASGGPRIYLYSGHDSSILPL